MDCPNAWCKAEVAHFRTKGHNTKYCTNSNLKGGTKSGGRSGGSPKICQKAIGKSAPWKWRPSYLIDIANNLQYSLFLDKGIIGCPATRGQLSPSGRPLRSCTVRFMLRPAVLVSTPGWVRPAISASRLGTVSGQVQPACYHTNPPPAYLSKRAIDKITSFQVIR